MGTKERKFVTGVSPSMGTVANGSPSWVDFAHGQAHDPFAHGLPINYVSITIMYLTIRGYESISVSYTHLTLPTICSV